MKIQIPFNISLENLEEAIKWQPQAKLFYLTFGPSIGFDWTYDHQNPCNENEQILMFAEVHR